jgi:flavin reductase (DIM6/NTAB) family NADH-FMN oxidoreductase RutF
MKKSLGARTLAVPTPTWVVGTYDAAGRANGATVAWAGICCSRPPCVAVSLRRATYTHGSIVARRAFTVGIPTAARAREADYLGIASGRDLDKLAHLGLTVVRSELVDAPYVAEFPIVLECRLLQTVEIGSHTQFVGEILDVKAEESVLDARGQIDPLAARPIVFASGADAYFTLGEQLGPAFAIGRGI